MALNDPVERAAAVSLPAGIDHALLENDGPTAHGDRMGTPAPDEKVLWKGRPSLPLLARTAFHTHRLALYFAVLVAIALAIGNRDAALVASVLGVVLMLILTMLAWMSTRTTLYILTDTRLIMRIGMAIETRINIPLKQVTAAHYRDRGKGHGDIALEVSGERLLGYLLLWPHVRAWRYARPQPMLRAIPDAAKVAKLMADVRGQFGAIERNLTEIKDAPATAGHHGPVAGPAVVRPAAASVRLPDPGQPGFEGAPA